MGALGLLVAGRLGKGIDLPKTRPKAGHLVKQQDNAVTAQYGDQTP